MNMTRGKMIEILLALGKAHTLACEIRDLETTKWGHSEVQISVDIIATEIAYYTDRLGEG
jgi:hypothetical protein